MIHKRIAFESTRSGYKAHGAASFVVMCDLFYFWARSSPCFLPAAHKGWGATVHETVSDSQSQSAILAIGPAGVEPQSAAGRQNPSCVAGSGAGTTGSQPTLKDQKLVKLRVDRAPILGVVFPGRAQRTGRALAYYLFQHPIQAQPGVVRKTPEVA